MNAAPELLEAAAQGDEQACEQMLRENSGLIWSIVRRYYGRGVEPDDLYQLGCLGFIKAVKGFDLTFGTQFSTYAVPVILGEIRRFLYQAAMQLVQLLAYHFMQGDKIIKILLFCLKSPLKSYKVEIASGPQTRTLRIRFMGAIGNLSAIRPSLG